ncbi:glycosyltransferase family 4 protein [Chryseobacterium salivictor]|uniref:Poly(Glycerol-phosphate) alpha-glucosyltransferase n=1 Tax=Chryseobacterium salivictor TaxID=2547600 RepID=A0A4V1AL33_9FLAO|nr:glycosyltransferase family 4 protein [Chryseobacterium salivictor]QBO58364.1 Poly(glycerol-phosphate) alpha-glucosyltransferase [Chryseobacterium salivictor]
MKVLYLTDQTFLHGGVEKVLSQKANYLTDQLGDEVTIVTYRQQNQKPVYAFSDKIKLIDLGVDYEIVKSYFHPHNLKKIPHHFASLKKVLKDIQPDVIISCSFGPDFYFMPFLEKQIPKIKEFHSSRHFYSENSYSAKDKLLNILSATLEKKYHQLVVLNESEKEFYQNNQITVIPNPAEISEKRAEVSSKKIMAAGRISPVKNFGDLIEAFAKVIKDFPDWELHFFGEDYVGTQGKLEQKINAYGLQNHIKFMGVSPDLKTEMQHYSIYALTSETECFPMVLLEALSVGMPVISYDSPTGPKHILTDNEDSFLVPYKNLDIFVEKLTELMQNEDLRHEMGQKGRQNVQRFSIEKVMHQWKDLFTSLINKTSNIQHLSPISQHPSPNI